MAKEYNVKVSEAVQTGNRKDALIAIRDHLAADMDNTETTARDRAAIAKQLQAVLTEIEELAEPDKANVTPLDAVRSRRKAS